MKQYHIFTVLCFFCIVISTFQNAYSEAADVYIYVLHDSLGEVIDAQENSCYNIFGDIKGFCAARIHHVRTGKYQVHLLRNLEGKAQIIVKNLPLYCENRPLCYLIEKRRRALQKKKIKFENSLYHIKESEWHDTSENKKLILRDGSQIIGTLKQVRSDTLIIQTLGGIVIEVPDANIAKVENIRGEIIEGRVYRTDPNQSRLFFAPTGRPLSQGHGYFADYFLFFPTVAYGISDFFSFGAGISLIPGADSQVLYFTPKFTFKLSPKAGVSGGIMYLGIPEDNDDLKLGYVVTSLGSGRNGITFGIGHSFTFGTDPAPILLIGAEQQVSNSVKFITENWVFTGGNGFTLFSGGIRFLGYRYLYLSHLLMQIYYQLTFLFLNIFPFLNI